MDQASSQGRPKPRITGPRDMANSLQQRHSTKQLISRYESMGRPAPRSSSGTSPKFFRSISSSKENRPPSIIKSPIRQSFTNLLSVFKIGNSKSLGKGSTRASSQPVDGTSACAYLASQQASCGVARANLVSGGISQARLTSQKDLHSGTLFYLSHPPDGQRASLILPVWTACTVALKPGQVFITWLTTQRNPSTHTISLTSCTDVRSLSLEQLDPSELALLPTTVGPEEIRVFEMLFEGRPREKFAASSLQERAGWVTAIW